jgi:hypothetical protein
MITLDLNEKELPTLQIIHTESNLCLTFTHQLFPSNCTEPSYQFFIFEEIPSTFLEAKAPKLQTTNSEPILTLSTTPELHGLIMPRGAPTPQMPIHDGTQVTCSLTL